MPHMKCVSWFVITRNIIIRVAPRRKVRREEKERVSLESPVKKSAPRLVEAVGEGRGCHLGGGAGALQKCHIRRL